MLFCICFPQSTELVSLLLNTLMLSVPLSGTAQESLINFSHGEYFYSLFLEIINQELLKNLEIAVLELMKSALDSPKMVLDFSFKMFKILKCSFKICQHIYFLDCISQKIHIETVFQLSFCFITDSLLILFLLNYLFFIRYYF